MISPEVIRLALNSHELLSIPEDAPGWFLTGHFVVRAEVPDGWATTTVEGKGKIITGWEMAWGGPIAKEVPSRDKIDRLFATGEFVTRIDRVYATMLDGLVIQRVKPVHPVEPEMWPLAGFERGGRLMVVIAARMAPGPSGY